MKASFHLSGHCVWSCSCSCLCGHSFPTLSCDRKKEWKNISSLTVERATCPNIDLVMMSQSTINLRWLLFLEIHPDSPPLEDDVARLLAPDEICHASVQSGDFLPRLKSPLATNFVLDEHLVLRSITSSGAENPVVTAPCDVHPWHHPLGQLPSLAPTSSV